MVEWVLMPEAWVAMTTLLALEIVLSIDNIIISFFMSAKLMSST